MVILAPELISLQHAEIGFLPFNQGISQVVGAAVGATGLTLGGAAHAVVASRRILLGAQVASSLLPPAPPIGGTWLEQRVAIVTAIANLQIQLVRTLFTGSW